MIKHVGHNINEGASVSSAIVFAIAAATYLKSL